jgi:hypothetical protein
MSEDGMSGGGDGDNYEYEWPSGEEQEEDIDENEILIKNTFDEADDNKKTRPEDALSQFEQVVDMEE